MSIERFGIRISPLAGFAEGYRTELTQLGYAPASVRLQLKVLADLGRTLETSAHVQRHRKRVRHDRHRTVRSKGCLSNKTALAMIFKLAHAAEKTWRRLDGHNQLPLHVI
jgi:hypothetical protein